MRFQDYNLEMMPPFRKRLLDCYKIKKLQSRFSFCNFKSLLFIKQYFPISLTFLSVKSCKFSVSSYFSAEKFGGMPPIALGITLLETTFKPLMHLILNFGALFLFWLGITFFRLEGMTLFKGYKGYTHYF